MAPKDLLNSLDSTSTSSTAAGPLSADLRASYTLNATIAGLEEATLLLVGSIRASRLPCSTPAFASSCATAASPSHR